MRCSRRNPDYQESRCGRDRPLLECAGGPARIAGRSGESPWRSVAGRGCPIRRSRGRVAEPAGDVELREVVVEHLVEHPAGNVSPVVRPSIITSATISQWSACRAFSVRVCCHVPRPPLAATLDQCRDTTE